MRHPYIPSPRPMPRWAWIALECLAGLALGALVGFSL